MGADDRVLEFKITMTSPLLVPGGHHQGLDTAYLRYVPASSLRCLMRHLFVMLYDSKSALDELFGVTELGEYKPAARAQMIVADFKVLGVHNTEIVHAVSIDRASGSANSSQLRLEERLAAGTELEGKILFDQDVSGLHVSLA
jgi:CRISPR/Cas system CSM-associated protein Csm3 (group 7 of RAMP superfamily)